MVFESGSVEVQGEGSHSSWVPRRGGLQGVIAVVTLLLAGGAAVSQTATVVTPPAMGPKPPPGAVRETAATDRVWSFEFGVGVVSDNTLSDYLDAGFDRLGGRVEGSPTISPSRASAPSSTGASAA